MDHGYSSWKWRSVSPAYQLHRWAALGLAAVASVGCGATSRNKGDDNNNAGVMGGTGMGQGGNQTAGTGGSPDGGSGDLPRINLEGDPKYFRFVRLTNSQWAKSVQEVLKLAQPSGLEVGLSAPVSGITDFSNNELLLDVDGHNWSEFQAAAEALAEQERRRWTAEANERRRAAGFPGDDDPLH